MFEAYIFSLSILDWSLMLLVQTARIAGKNNYPDTVKAAFGKPGYVLVTITLLAYTFGSKI
jgi:amino acid permease